MAASGPWVPNAAGGKGTQCVCSWQTSLELRRGGARERRGQGQGSESPARGVTMDMEGLNKTTGEGQTQGALLLQVKERRAKSAKERVPRELSPGRRPECPKLQVTSSIWAGPGLVLCLHSHTQLSRLPCCLSIPCLESGPQGSPGHLSPCPL